ncbi:MAG: glycosyltransferase family 2 protein [Roseinatronobacter sp.]
MINVVIPMAGGDQMFREADYPFAKPIIEIAGRPLIEHAFDGLRAIPDARFIFIIRKEDDLRFHLRDVLQLMAPGCVVIHAEGETAGAACTALLAIDYLLNDAELLIANADQVLRADLAGVLDDFRARALDAGTIIFDSVHPRWSFVKTDADGQVIEAAEKRPISRNATAGVYYFRRSADFVAAAQASIRKGASVNGRYFVCPTFNELVLNQKRIGVWPIAREDYISLATPQAVEDFDQSLKRERRSATHAVLQAR